MSLESITEILISDYNVKTYIVNMVKMRCNLYIYSVSLNLHNVQSARALVL